MKLSYSKLLVRGVIATTLLMSMSCQKKGSARVAPQTATKADAPDKAADNTTDIKDHSLENVPGKDIVAPTVSSGDRTKVAPHAEDPKVAVTTSADNSTVKTAAEPETKKEDAKEKTADDKAHKKEDGVMSCSTEVVKARTGISAQYSKVTEINKDLDSTIESKISAYTEFLTICKQWTDLFAKEKIESCLAADNVHNIKSIEWADGCMFVGGQLKVLSGKDNEYSLALDKQKQQILNTLKADKLVVSSEGQDMFLKDNQNWKMFVVDGQLQTDAMKLQDSVKDKKVACTISSIGEKSENAQVVEVSITSAHALAPKSTEDVIQRGVDIGLSLKIEAETEGDALKTVEATLSCSNLESRKLNINLLKAALGDKLKKAEKVEPKAQKQN
jgi:hypothetical protein